MSADLFVKRNTLDVPTNALRLSLPGTTVIVMQCKTRPKISREVAVNPIVQ